jgi:flagellar basal-body rod protein FlgC
MDLMSAINVSASGMSVQSSRMKVIAENVANADSLVTPEGGPYRRKVISFETVLDRNTGLQKVKVADISKDMNTPLKMQYNPSHSLADENGYVAKPNVNHMIESIDMRDAKRAYEANMAAIESAKDMMVKSIDLLR